MNRALIEKEIVDLLRPLNPQKIILFGSRAYGQPAEESDIDLYIVTSDETMPQNFQESMAIKLKVARALRELRKTMDIDLVVHTQAMEKKFLEKNSLFAQKIHKEGIVLYERTNEGMASSR